MWGWKALQAAKFPITSDLYWGIGTILFLLWVGIGESLWLAGVTNFTAYTWFLRVSIPRPVLIGVSIGLAAFIVWHFAYATGFRPGRNP